MAYVSGEKPYACNQGGCKKAFSTQYSLKSHIVRHNRTKVCDIFPAVNQIASMWPRILQSE